MPHSFTAKEKVALADSEVKRRQVLVTGAAGNIGSYFAEHSHHRYDLRLMIREKDEHEDADTVKKLRKWGELVVGELRDLDQLKQHCRNIDTIVHMAANPSPNAQWDSLLH